MLGDVTDSEKPDIPGVAVDRSLTGWAGWGDGRAGMLVSMCCTMTMFATTGRNELWKPVLADTAVRGTLVRLSGDNLTSDHGRPAAQWQSLGFSLTDSSQPSGKEDADLPETIVSSFDEKLDDHSVI